MTTTDVASGIDFTHVLQLIQDQRRLKDRLNREEFVLVEPDQLRFFASLFVQFYVKREDELRDDLLFFVKLTEDKSSSTTNVEQDQDRFIVLRKDSPQIPSMEDKRINWEETLYLNIILHQFEYYLTCGIAVMQEGSPLQIHRKLTHQVFASPSQRRMDKKGVETCLRYPYAFFTVDGFDEVFQELVLMEGQRVIVELLAIRNVEGGASHCAVIFLGSVKYDVLLSVYKSKVPSSSKIVHRMSLGFWGGGDHVHFVQMRGPGGKGHAEVAISPYRGKTEQNEDTGRGLLGQSASSVAGDDTPPVTSEANDREESKVNCESSSESPSPPTSPADHGQTRRRGENHPRGPLPLLRQTHARFFDLCGGTRSLF